MKELWQNLGAIFAERYPALLFGLCLFLGALLALQSPWAILPAMMLLCFTSKRFFPYAVFAFLLPLPLIYHFYCFPPSGSEVEGRFHIQHVQQTDHFSKGWIYRGVLKTDEGRLYCQIYSKEYHPANRHYHLRGKLRTRDRRYYTLKPEIWSPIKRSWSLAHLRLHAKIHVKKYIQRHIHHERATTFLIGMATGNLEDRVMQNEFGNLGLSHIMAISGFHFALLALAFNSILRLFFSTKIEAILLILILTLYLLFIGDSPSVLRAWIFAMVLLFGRLLEKESIALNSLGVALILGVLLNPLSVKTLSFQLSFLATAGILAFYHPVNCCLQFWLPKVSLKEALDHHRLWQYGYIVTALFREAFALTLAVNLAVTPLLLFHFHLFSLNGLFYNLFFPFLASIGMFLLLLGVVLGPWIHWLNGWYCTWILKIVESPPLEFKSFYVDQIPGWTLAFYYMVLLIGGLLFNTIEMRVNPDLSESRRDIAAIVD